MNISQDSVTARLSGPSSGSLGPYARAWILIGSVMAVDIAGLCFSGRRIAIGSASQTALAVLAIALVSAWIEVRTKAAPDDGGKWKTRLLDLAFTARWMIALAAFCVAANVLVHLSVIAHFPLIDAQLVKADRAIGFDWMAWYRWMRQHPACFTVLNFAYATGLAQMIAVPVILGMTGRRSECVQHATRLVIATLICLVIATLFPAASAYLHFQITDPGTSSTVSSFFPLRDGAIRIIDLDDPQGLVSMPSMHTTMAVLFAYALRRVPVLGPIAAVLNVLMIVSTPTHGGHYLVDTLAGIVLALVSIAVTGHRRVLRLISDDAGANTARAR